MYFSTNEHPGTLQSESVAAAFSLTQRAFQCFEELVRFNQQMIKATLVESEKAWQVATSGKAPGELWVEQTRAARSLAEKALSYNHQMLALATHTQVELMKFTKAGFEYHNGKLQVLVDGVATHAPAGSDAAVTALKSTVSSAAAAYDAVLKATAQAIAVAQRNQPAAPAPEPGAEKVGL
ncbi:TIGR01841 family phasin [Paraburkholderia ginsengisoli]|uniref:TIGR01841 family phasin n=1 Tax=Paraburkholderia ginsengisoli TaxID=311231 RepID=A0A7T4N839_9BURK|nr:TIGR01841 family phasin [Paraburkholderia ginsengisoli]QQC66973.1 TIGR01841 family phasin [Paraburkholderia ginsengisoli]